MHTYYREILCNSDYDPLYLGYCQVQWSEWSGSETFDWVAKQAASVLERITAAATAIYADFVLAVCLYPDREKIGILGRGRVTA